MTDVRHFVKNLLGFSIVPVFTALITVFVIPLISNIFPTEEYGKINIFYTVGALIMTSSMLGLDSSFIRYFYEPPKGLTNKGIAAIALIVGSLVVIIGIIFVYLFACDRVTESLFGEVNPFGLALLAIYSISLCIFRIVNIDARMKEDVRTYSIQSIVQCFVTRISFVIVAIWSTYYLYSIEVMTFGIAVLAAICLLIQRKSVSLKNCEVNRTSLMVLMKFGIPSMITAFVLNLNASIGKIVLGSYGMFEAVGILAIAVTLANVFSIIPTAFSNYWSPFMYKNYRNERPFITMMHDYVMLGTIAIVILIILFQNPLFKLVGPDYASCQSFFMLIMLNPIQMLICETTTYGITIKERPTWNTVISIIGLVICTGLTILLINKIGVNGAAVAIAISAIFIGIARSIIGQKYYRTVEKPIKSILVTLIIIAICFLNGLMFNDVVLRLTICGTSIVFVFLLYRNEILRIKNEIIPRLLKK